MVTFNIQMGHPDRLVALRKGDVINVIGKLVGDIEQGEGGWWPLATVASARVVASAGEPEAPTLTFLLQIGLETDSGPRPLGRMDSKIKGVKRGFPCSYGI